jgi:hypothetical protein
MEEQLKAIANKYVEPGIISARFILALCSLVVFAYGKMDASLFGGIIIFYFGSHTSTATLNKVIDGIKRNRE